MPTQTLIRRFAAITLLVLLPQLGSAAEAAEAEEAVAEDKLINLEEVVQAADADTAAAEAALKNAQPRVKNRSQVPETPGAVLRLDETVISGNQELPKVLYILPWREPQGLPDIEIQAEFTEAEVFRRLYPPAYRRELSYFETLRGLQENISPDQEE